MKEGQKTEIKISAKSDVGIKREHNEDDFIICPDLSEKEWSFEEGTTISINKKGCLLVIADGMGGVNAGDVASKLATKSVKNYFNQYIDTFKTGESEIKKFLFKSIHYANKQIVNHAKTNPETEGMGTTIVMAWVVGDKAFIAWVGDSRAYVVHRDSNLERITKDHSLVQNLIDEGLINEDQAFFHPQSNIITQSLGEEKHRLIPGFKVVNLAWGTHLLLCSDGLNAMLKDEQIHTVFKENAPDLSNCTQSLIEQANQAGGLDNTTIAIVSIENDPGLLSEKIIKSNKPIKLAISLFILLMIGLFTYQWIERDEGMKAKPTQFNNQATLSPLDDERHLVGESDILEISEDSLKTKLKLQAKTGSDAPDESTLNEMLEELSSGLLKNQHQNPTDSLLIFEIEALSLQLKNDYSRYDQSYTLCYRMKKLDDMLIKLMKNNRKISKEIRSKLATYSKARNSFIDRKCDDS